jgi:Trk-type K+ transport system membrane component
VTFPIVLALSILIARIATVALMHTRLARESAKFQTRSAFTGVGFTASESDKAVSHPMHRWILRVLMLFGNAGIVTAVSSMIISFVDILPPGQKSHMSR